MPEWIVKYWVEWLFGIVAAVLIWLWRSMVKNIRKEKEEQVFSQLGRVAKSIADYGFMARRLSKPELKRMIALYFGTSISGECIPDVEGADYLQKEEKDAV